MDDGRLRPQIERFHRRETERNDKTSRTDRLVKEPLPYTTHFTLLY